MKELILECFLGKNKKKKTGETQNNVQNGTYSGPQSLDWNTVMFSVTVSALDKTVEHERFKHSYFELWKRTFETSLMFNVGGIFAPFGIGWDCNLKPFANQSIRYLRTRRWHRRDTSIDLAGKKYSSKSNFQTLPKVSASTADWTQDLCIYWTYKCNALPLCYRGEELRVICMSLLIFAIWIHTLKKRISTSTCCEPFLTVLLDHRHSV